MVNYYVTIISRSDLTGKDLENYINTKVPAIWRKKVKEELDNSVESARR